MKFSRFTSLIAVFGFAGVTLTGCGKKNAEAGHDHGAEKGESAGHGHGHGEEAASGASFKKGKGVILSDETRQNLGVETAEVIERSVPLEVRFTAQVFGEDHKHTAVQTHHAECSAKAAGLIGQDKAGQIKPGKSAQVSTKAGESFGGVILGLNKDLAIGDVEVLVGITNSVTQLKPGDFLSVVVTIPREQFVAAIPKSAVLRTAEGTFAYTQNGDAYFRTAIKTGAEAESLVEVTDGLLTGDVVVTTPVEKLWLIELRATKGGGHSH